MRHPLLLALTLSLAPAPATAGRHVVERGETLEHVARVHGCSVDAVLRANRLKTTLVRPGTVVTVPACNLTARARTRSRPGDRRGDGRLARDDRDDRAARALAAIDGTAIVETARPADIERAEPGEAVGRPWDGRLRNGQALPVRDGYRIRRPHRAYGASHVIDHLQRAVAGVRALYDVHTLAIGDLSAPGGGKLGDHHSHQSGLDVDVGFYFRRVPDDYPARFAAADGELDLDATWALLLAFVRTADLDTGVQTIFLDHAVQARLYRFARARGTPEADLRMIFQYPRASDAQVGLVRHWPNHQDHLHVRFKPGR